MIVAFLLFGGVIADRMSPRRAMLVADFGRMATMGLMGVLLVTGHAQVWELAVLYATEGLGTAVFNPASNALVPIVVDKGELQSANALLTFSKSSGVVIGPLIVGLLLAISTPGVAIIVDAATFGVSGFFLLRIAAKSVREAAGSSFIEDLREGWTEFSSRTWLWVCVAASAFTNAIFVPGFLVLGPTVARESLGGSGAWVLIVAVFGAGTIVGSIIGMAIRTRHKLLVSQAVILVFVLPLILLAAEVSAFVVAAGALFAGGALSITAILYGTTFQEHVPAQAMARVAAYDWFGSLALQPIGYALVGALAARVGNSELLLVMCALLVCTQCAALLVPSVRRLESRADEEVGDEMALPPPILIAPEED